jgi:hypothetical protein
MNTENPEQGTATTARKARRQQSAVQSKPLKTVQLEDAVYTRLLERADVKEALFSLESAQTKRDSVSRKLCGGSSAVAVDDLSRWETELAAAKATLMTLAEDAPLLMKHPVLAAH